MWQNYLDYTDDLCMDRFTPNQVTRMRNILTTNSIYTNIVSQNNFSATGGDIATSVSDLSPSASFSIYPNPAQNTIWVEWKKYTPSSEFALLGIDGKVLLKGRVTGTRQAINISWLKPGAYAIRMNGELRKLIKQ